MWVYAGTYGPEIIRFHRDPDTGMLSGGTAVADLLNASWLTWHPRDAVMYAVSETDEGAVAAFRLQDERLEPLGGQPSHGGEPCHVAVDPGGRFLLAANYGGGNVTVLPIGPDGSLAAASDAVNLPGGPGKAHAHQIVFHGGDVVVTDLGNDEIRRYTLDSEEGRLLPGSSPVTRAPGGCGPRHLLFHPSGYQYATAELVPGVLVFDPDFQLHHTLSATKSGDSENHPSGLTLSPDGRFLYVANRGPDVVTVFAVDGPHLEPVADVPVAGAWPRDITFIDGTLYIANQRSDTISVFEVEPGDGLPQLTGVVAVPKPARVLPGFTA